jgi:hypothetical protein
MKTAINHKGYEMTRQEYLDFVKKTFEDMMELIRKKNTDYSQDADPFSNFRSAKLYGVDPLVGLCVRMGDKLARIQSFCKSGSLQSESVDDAFRDLIGYSCIALGMLQEKAKVSEPDADEVYEWQWELDSGTDYWTTGLYFTEDEIRVQAADIPHKHKLEHTKRRRRT